MSAKALSEVYEKLKELRRQGRDLNLEQQPIGHQLMHDDVPDRFADMILKLAAAIDVVDKTHQSANLFRALEIKTLADRIFGDEEKAEAWLQRPNGALSGQKPADLLKDELGTSVVRELLERIDHGIFAGARIMDLWRISNYADLSGIGGVRAAGRWHSQGRRIVYLADHPSSALLEMLVHMDRDLIPPTYQLLRIVPPAGMAIETIGLDELPPDWQTRTTATRGIGDRWLDRSGSALLQVPSAISHQGQNFLMNPAHPDAAAIIVAEIFRAPFDTRLLK